MNAAVEVDYYAILKVRQEADIDEIKRAFRRLAPLCHPDKNPKDPDACKKFISLREAHDTLTDTSRRFSYDLRYQKTRKEQETSSYRQNVEKETQERERVEKLKLDRERLIAQIKLDMDKVDKEIGEIERRRKEREKERYASSWWKFFTALSASETEEEKMNRERENLHQLASERINLERLAQNRTRLQRNLDEQKEAMNKEMREYILQQKMEQERLAREREIRDRERRERLAKEMEERERMAWERAASERLAKEREERERMAWERAASERAAKERESRMREEIKRMERRRELREQDARERAAKEKAMKERKNTAAPRNLKGSDHLSGHKGQKSACRHDKFWPKVEGHSF
ncbi:MAG: hypothetical protein M1816_002777 [Peltula sp. TS41687]|nr:MAG: hypothetical protein M1816_002777 [Peltula sp. TS41687]